jgi:filamentous hemagglutinin family protein
MRRESPVLTAATANQAAAPRAHRLACAVAIALAFGAQGALAQSPSGGSVAQGTANIFTPSSNSTLVQVTSNKAVINWNDFSVGNGNLVQFIQNSASSVALNRVTGGNASTIAGNLTANGQIFLVNPNGVFFTSTASVNVGGLIASTLNIADTDFMAGNYVFTKVGGSPLGQVVNNGSITTSTGGFAALFGEQVTNGATGVISSPSGKVALGVGEKITVSFDSNQLLSFTVDQKAVANNAYATNNGQLLSDGGSVQMTAGVANALSGAVVNQNGVIRAAGVSTRNGEVILSADGGDIDVAATSTIEAGALTGATSAASVSIQAQNGAVTVHDGSSISAGGAGGANVLLSGTSLSLGGNISAQSTESNAFIGMGGNGIALNNANVQASGFMSSFISLSSGTGGITQDAAGQLRSVTTASASQAAGQGGYAFGGVTLDGSGSHVLAGSIEARATGPDAFASASVNSASGAISAGNINVQTDQGGTGATLSLTAGGNINVTGPLSNSADAGPANTLVRAGGSLNVGGNISVQGLSGTGGTATLASLVANGGNLVMAPGKSVTVTDLTSAGNASNGAGLALSATGSVSAGDLTATSAAGPAQVAVSGDGGVLLNGNVSASGRSALVDVRAAGGNLIAVASGKTVEAVSTVAGGGGALVSLSTPGGSLRLDGTLSARALNGDSARVITNPSLAPAGDALSVWLAMDNGQSILARLLAISRSTPVNPLSRGGLIVMPNWNIVGASLYSGTGVDAALLEDDEEGQSINPTSDIQTDAPPVNAAMIKR